MGLWSMLLCGGGPLVIAGRGVLVRRPRVFHERVGLSRCFCSCVRVLDYSTCVRVDVLTCWLFIESTLLILFTRYGTRLRVLTININSTCLRVYEARYCVCVSSGTSSHFFTTLHVEMVACSWCVYVLCIHVYVLTCLHVAIIWYIDMFSFRKRTFMFEKQTKITRAKNVLKKQT